MPRRFNRELQMLNIDNFSGGLSWRQSGPSEAEVFTNWEMARDGFPITRLGTELVNANSIDTNMINGMGLIGAGNTMATAQVYLVVTKSSGMWYYAPFPGSMYTLDTRGAPQLIDGGPANYPLTFSTFTPAIIPDFSQVRMESVIDNSGNPWGVFANAQFGGLLQWNAVVGSQATLTAGSPAATIIRHFNSRLYAAGIANNPYLIQFSDIGNPLSWPTTNTFNILAKYGIITGLEEQLGQLYVFTDRCILVIQGDPPNDFRLIALHPRVGCAYPNTISTLGATTAFYHNGNVYSMSGGEVDNISGKIAGLVINGAGCNPNRAWGALTNFQYVINTSQNNSNVNAPAPTVSQTNQAYVLQRSRFNFWSLWNYPNNCGVGQFNPYQAVVFAPKSDGYLIGGGDGNVYHQPFRQFGDLNLVTGNEPFTVDVGVTNPYPVSTYRSSQLTMGDATMQTMIRRVLVAAQGQNASINLGLWDANDVKQVYNVLSGGAFPATRPGPGVLTRTGAAGGLMGIQPEVSASQCRLRAIGIEWKPIRQYTGAGPLT
jgi:hypothetical protein